MFIVREGILKEEKSFLKNANKEYNESVNEADSYLITPYFINETILKSDILKIEEILLEKFGNRVDKSEIPSINYINNSNFVKNKTSPYQENREAFSLINYFVDNNVYVIDVDKVQKDFEFEKISENTFIKRYLIPDELKQNKNELGLKSILREN